MPTDTFTSGSGNYTVPAGVTTITEEAWGPGGGGGGANGAAGGGGGGSGGYSLITKGVTPGALIAYSVGTVGSAGTGAPTNGGTGTATTVDGLTANGGFGGDSGNLGGGGGGGGTASGGSTNSTGNSGIFATGGAGGAGGAGIGGVGAGGRGGNFANGSGVAGSNGQVSFTYTAGEEALFLGRSCIAGGSCSVPLLGWGLIGAIGARLWAYSRTDITPSLAWWRDSLARVGLELLGGRSRIAQDARKREGPMICTP